MMYVGLDYHKRYSVATKMGEGGEVLEQVKLLNHAPCLMEFLNDLPQDAKIALEATGSWYWLYELLEDRGTEVHLAHPLRTRAIAEARIKTDRIDSRILAHLLRTDLLPTAYIPPRAVRDVREILRYRASLISMRTQVKNKVHAILSKNGIRPRYTDLFGKGSLRQLQALDLRPAYALELRGYLRLAEALQQLIAEVDARVEEIATDDPRAILLTTIPGIGYYSALLIISEIGDIARFPNARKLCSYAGLVPRVHSSGGRTRYGPITKQGSKYLRWIMVELSPHFCRGSSRMERLYRRVCLRHGKNAARVAVAREMLKVIYYMLRDERPFFKD
ncbi:MAG: IS110 family transposase [Actinobacteria bacterium]|nr:IS110 family transposase [Actinomycetota bacterium]